MHIAFATRQTLYNKPQSSLKVASEVQQGHKLRMFVDSRRSVTSLAVVDRSRSASRF